MNPRVGDHDSSATTEALISPGNMSFPQLDRVDRCTVICRPEYGWGRVGHTGLCVMQVGAVLRSTFEDLLGELDDDTSTDVATWQSSTGARR